MSAKNWVEVWDSRPKSYSGDKTAYVAVTWSAIGPVHPRVARAFAERVLLAADKADKVRAKREKQGYKVTSRIE